MPSRDYDMDRTPNGKDDKETLEFYKSQIETLENELAEFQASSRELEQELEKELEASEKQHRDLKHKNEQLRYEVEEWKVFLNGPICRTPCSRGLQFCGVYGLACHLATVLMRPYRTSTSSPSKSPTLLRMRCKKKSPRCGSRTGT